MTDNTSQSAIVALPQVGDPAVLADILMYSACDALHAVMTNGDPNDYANVVFGVASLFMGQADSVELPKGWDAKAAGAALRVPMAEVLESMPPEDLATFEDDESLIPLAVMTCFQEAMSITEAWGETHQVEKPEDILKGVLHDELFAAHFLNWAEIILGGFAVKSQN